jgi:tetratricopeptide (TPR) repeat protein
VRAEGDTAALTDILKRAQRAGLSQPVLDYLAARSTGQRQGPRDPGRKQAASVMALLRKGKPGEALSAARAAAAAHPGSGSAHAVLGIVLATAGQTGPAEAAFRRALMLDPGDADSAANLAEAMLQQRRSPEVAEMLAPIVATAPGHARARSFYGRALSDLGRLEAAEVELERAQKLAPKDALTRFFLGEVRVRQNRPEAALAPLEAAIAGGLRSPRVLTEYGKALTSLGENQAAMAALNEALERDPRFAEAAAARAMLLLYTGDFTAAERDFQTAIAGQPENGAFYRMAVVARKIASGDPMIGQMEQLWEKPDLDAESRSELGFALAKVMDDTGQTDRVFTYLRPANDIMRARFAYDIRADAAQMRGLCNAFRNAPRIPPDGDRGPGPQPVFVTGPPRSGTTLVEQILASHSEVTGAGELKLFTEALNPHIPAIIAAEGAPATVYAETGRAYMQAVAARYPGARRLVDKSIGTFQVIGYVPLALPDARTVLVRRDPRDVGLSIYRNRFGDRAHLYSNDLRDIGFYLRLFEEVAGFWREAAPDAFIEVEYETLIAEPEAETRRLVAGCGLEWEQACLDFHQTTRRVDTLSVFQVRQPIYRSSLQGWQKYETELEPMLEALETPGSLLFPD